MNYNFANVTIALKSITYIVSCVDVTACIGEERDDVTIAIQRRKVNGSTTLLQTEMFDFIQPGVNIVEPPYKSTLLMKDQPPAKTTPSNDTCTVEPLYKGHSLERPTHL